MSATQKVSERGGFVCALMCCQSPLQSLSLCDVGLKPLLGGRPPAPAPRDSCVRNAETAFLLLSLHAPRIHSFCLPCFCSGFSIFSTVSCQNILLGNEVLHLLAGTLSVKSKSCLRTSREVLIQSLVPSSGVWLVPWVEVFKYVYRLRCPNLTSLWTCL